MQDWKNHARWIVINKIVLANKLRNFRGVPQLHRKVHALNKITI